VFCVDAKGCWLLYRGSSLRKGVAQDSVCVCVCVCVCGDICSSSFSFSSSSSSSSSFCGLPVANAPDVLQPCGLLYYP
jgi:phosphatidylserine synthase